MRIQGFTIVELVVVMVIITGGLLGLAKLFNVGASSVSENETVQQAAQYAQECAERIIQERRDNHYSSSNLAISTNSSVCGSSPSGFTRTVAIASLSGGACASGATCKTANIQVSVGSTNYANITLMLVSY